MNKVFIAILLLVVVIVGAIIFFSKGNLQPAPAVPQTGNQPAPAATDNPAPASGSQAVNITNFSFQPAVLTIAAGTSVVWTNDDSLPHQIKSDTFNSAQLAKGQTFTFTFDKAGTYDYFCSIHPSMKGKIIVQ